MTMRPRRHPAWTWCCPAIPTAASCCPFNFMGEWMGLDDKRYGLERRGNTDFIVTSGISDWAIQFKTGCRSEYVVIDVAGALR